MAFHANHALDGPMDARVSEIAKCYIFEIPPKTKFITLLLLTTRDMQFVCETHLQPFKFRLKQVVTDMISFGHSNHHLKIMHVSVKKHTIFCIFRPTGIHWTIQYVICI